jgi:hypothetical protein
MVYFSGEVRMERLQRVLLRSQNPKASWALAALFVLVALCGGAYIAFLSPMIAWGLTIAIIGVILTLSDIKWGFFGLVAIIYLLPFGVLPLRLGFYPTFLDAALLLVFGAWITGAALKKSPIDGSPIGPFIVAFILLACASFVAGLAHAELTATTLRHFVEIILAIALFFAVINTLKEKVKLKQVVAAIGAFALAEAIIAIVIYFLPSYTAVRILSALGRVGYPTGWGVLRYVENNPELPLRAVGTSIDPNVLGGSMMIAIALFTPQLFARKPFLPRYLVLPSLAVLWFCLYLTYSRSALLGLLAALSIIGLVRYRAIFALVALAFLLVIFLPQAQPYLERLQAGLAGKDLATKMRFGEYKDALILISRYPWLGVGFSGTPDIDIYIGVSSLYLLMAEYIGIPGVGIFLTVVGRFFSLLFQKWKALTSDQEMEAIMVGLVGAIGGALVGGIFDHYFFNLDFPHSVSLFWLLVGLAVAALEAK